MFVIKTITAFVAEGEEGEGIVGELLGSTWMPFVCADEERIKLILPRIREMMIAKPDLKIKILQFTTRTDVTENYL